MSGLTRFEPQVTIMDINIRVLNGLFSLNDLHKASGGNPKHKPAFFLRTDQTKEVVTELHKSNSQGLTTTKQEKPR